MLSSEAIYNFLLLGISIKVIVVVVSSCNFQEGFDIEHSYFSDIWQLQLGRMKLCADRCPLTGAGLVHLCLVQCRKLNVDAIINISIENLSLCSRAKNVVAAARPPVRFFSPDAPVVDLYLGQIDQVRLEDADMQC